MFGLDPLSRSVAVTEILLLLAFIAFVGWLFGRLVLSGRVSSLRAAIAKQKEELDECRRAKETGGPGTVVRRPAETPPSFVHADPLLPALTLDDTPEILVEENPTDLSGSYADDPATSQDPEAAVLSRIAARADELNFDRIGRAAAVEADDLKDIVGVGPFLERKLHSLGIYTFRQIANFTKEDIDKVNEIVEFFPGRIERDNWVGQSKQFHERKYGASS